MLQFIPKEDNAKIMNISQYSGYVLKHRAKIRDQCAKLVLINHDKHSFYLISGAPADKSELLNFQMHCNQTYQKKKSIQIALKAIKDIPTKLFKQIDDFKNQWNRACIQRQTFILGLLAQDQAQKIVDQLLYQDIKNQKVEQIYQMLLKTKMDQIKDEGLLRNCLSFMQDQYFKAFLELGQNFNEFFLKAKERLQQFDILQDKNWIAKNKQFQQEMLKKQQRIILKYDKKMEENFVNEVKKTMQSGWWVFRNKKWGSIQSAVSKGEKLSELTQISLDLLGNEITRDDVVMLMDVHWLWSKVASIKLNHGFDDEKLKCLVSQKWQSVISLQLIGNKISNQGLKYLASQKWQRVIQLRLNFNSIDSQGIKHLVSQKWDNLALLSLDRNNIGSEGIRHLVSLKWEKLEDLSLDNNSIGDQGVKYLASRKWEKLRQLSLLYNNIGGLGIQYLINQNWNNLKKLILGDSGIGDSETKKLREKFKNIHCQILPNTTPIFFMSPPRRRF